MAKFSKFSRRQRKIACRKVGSCMHYRMPRMPRRVEPLSVEVEFRLRCVEPALSTSVDEAAVVFRRSPAMIYRWMKACRQHGIRGLKPKSRRPQRTCKQQWNAAAETAVLRLRQQYRRSGKAKRAVRLYERGLTFAEVVEQIGYSYCNVRKVLLQTGVTMRPKGI